MLRYAALALALAALAHHRVYAEDESLEMGDDADMDPYGDYGAALYPPPISYASIRP